MDDLDKPAGTFITIAQQQVGPVCVYCDGVGCHVLCLRHGIPVWQHIGQSTTATNRHCRDMTSDVKVTFNPNKQKSKVDMPYTDPLNINSLFYFLGHG